MEYRINSCCPESEAVVTHSGKISAKMFDSSSSSILTGFNRGSFTVRIQNRRTVWREKKKKKTARCLHTSLWNTETLKHALHCSLDEHVGGEKRKKKDLRFLRRAEQLQRGVRWLVVVSHHGSRQMSLPTICIHWIFFFTIFMSLHSVCVSWCMQTEILLLTEQRGGWRGFIRFGRQSLATSPI